MGDSRARGTALASRTFTIARDGGVTSAGEGAEGRAGPLGAEPRAAAKVDVYTRKLRKRLRDGVKRRGGGGWKVAPVSASVAALVTKEAVADIFPTGLAEGVCGMCTKQSTGLSLQLVSCCEEPAAVTLAPLCASCVVAFGVAEPKRGAPKRNVEKRYSVWKRLAKVEFRGRKDRKEKVAYFQRMMKAAEVKKSMVEPTDQVWTAASEAERSLFVVGLERELRMVNDKVSISLKMKMLKEKEGKRKVAENRRLAYERDAGHCVPDYLA